MAKLESINQRCYLFLQLFFLQPIVANGNYWVITYIVKCEPDGSAKISVWNSLKYYKEEETFFLHTKFVVTACPCSLNTFYNRVSCFAHTSTNNYATLGAHSIYYNI